MKTKIKLLFTALIVAHAFNIAAQQKPGKQTFKVSGNCEMCENTIEKAALKSGAAIADWNKDTKVLSVVYNPKKVSSDAILKGVANAGYDNEKYQAPEEAYSNLHDCCKYERSKNK